LLFVLCLISVKRRLLPHGKSSEHAACQEHANVNGSSLNNGANRANHTHQLHELNMSELVANEGLR
jgi:hypothetical protein